MVANLLENKKGSGQEVENQMIFASSVHPRTVGSETEVEN